MKVLIACEFSGIVRDAFRTLGHDAWSCDLLPTERPGQHIQDDVRNVLDAGWDLMVAHPPCTYSSYAGVRWFKTQPDRWRKMFESFHLFEELWNAPIPMIAIENPRGYVIKHWRQPNQIIHPYYFGDPMTKATCLWLKGLPKLWYTNQPDLFGNPQTVCNEYFVNWSKYKKGAHSGKARSVSFPGIAAAMANQWGRV